MKLALQKTIGHTLSPADPLSEELLQKIKPGEVIHGEYARMRNGRFHRKFFALLNLGFEYWQPGQIDSKYGTPEKNFDRFRSDVTILAGYYHTEIRLDGSVRVEPDSISFAAMDEDTFEKLYQSVLTVLMQRIPVLSGMAADEIDSLVDKFLHFA
jgi:hypothetical protein